MGGRVSRRAGARRSRSRAKPRAGARGTRRGAPGGGGTAGVVAGGELGILGNIGWFIPSYLLDEHPEFATYEGLKGNEALFATAETGDKGQFLGSDPNFGFDDEGSAQTRGLDFEFVYSGSETGSLAALDTAFANQEPLLMYFWSPHWAQAKYDLVEVGLPGFNEGCAQALENPDADGYACDYADDVLYRAFSADLATKDPAAFEFLSNFSWTPEDQNQVGVAINDGTDPLEAGRAWAAENEDVWSAWLPQAWTAGPSTTTGAGPPPP